MSLWGESGTVQCKMAVYYNMCGMCKAACVPNTRWGRIETLPSSTIWIRLGSINDIVGSLADISPQ